MKNNVQNISFKSNIRFVSHSQYKQLEQLSKVKVEEMWDINSVQKVEINGSTNGIRFCIAGVLKNLTDNNNFLFHWFPGKLYHQFKPGIPKTKKLKKIQEKIRESIKNKEVKGVLIGGLSKTSSKELNQLSLKLLNVLKKSFNAEERKNFTIFFSQGNFPTLEYTWHDSEFFYSKPQDTYYINTSSHTYHPKMESANLMDKDEIRQNFDLIHIANDDKVYIGLNSKTPIPNEFWNKNSFAKKYK